MKNKDDIIEKDNYLKIINKYSKCFDTSGSTQSRKK